MPTRDPYRDPVDDGDYYDPTMLDSGGVHLEPEPPSGAVVAQHRVVPHGELRADFGAHLETHYPRLVAQLYAITLHPGDAHEAVQDAYSRAWRRWTELRDDDVVGWVRRVAIRTSMRGWRPGLTRARLRRNRLPAAEALDPQTAALLQSLARLPVAVRRVVVLRHMAGLGDAEIADLERVGEPEVRERLRRGREAVHEGMDEMLGRVLDAAATADADHGADAGGRAGGRHGLRGERGMSVYSDIDRAFVRLDDVLAASVPLPAVDEVIGRAPSVRRASSAAAAAVLTVGSLGGITAVATAAAPQDSAASPPSAMASPSTGAPSAPLSPLAANPLPASPAAPALPPAFDPTGAAAPLVQNPSGSAGGGAVAAPIAPGAVAGPVAPAPGPVLPPRPAPGRPPAQNPPPPPETGPGGGEGTQDPPPTTEEPPPTTTEPPPSTTKPPPTTTTSNASSTTSGSSTTETTTSST